MTPGRWTETARTAPRSSPNCLTRTRRAAWQSGAEEHAPSDVRWQMRASVIDVDIIDSEDYSTLKCRSTRGIKRMDKSTAIYQDHPMGVQ